LRNTTQKYNLYFVTLAKVSRKFLAFSSALARRLCPLWRDAFTFYSIIPGDGNSCS